MATSWGITSPFVLALLTLLLTAMVYASGIWFGKRAVAASIFNSAGTAQNLSRLEKTFILLAIASLVNQMARDIVLTFVLFRLPDQIQLPDYGTMGFLAACFMGVILVSLTVIILYNHLPDENASLDRIP